MTMTHHVERPARGTTARLALYMLFAFIVAGILALSWIEMHG